MYPASTQCGVGPVCVPMGLLSTCLSPVWCWSSVCPVFNSSHVFVCLVCVVDEDFTTKLKDSGSGDNFDWDLK